MLRWLMNWKGLGRKQQHNWGTIPAFAWRKWGNEERSVGFTCVIAINCSERLLNTSLQYYHYTSMSGILLSTLYSSSMLVLRHKCASQVHQLHNCTKLSYSFIISKNLESPLACTISIMSLCCLRMWRIWCALRLQRCGQYGHWKVGSLPHSHCRWRWRESLRTYDRPQRSQGNTPRARPDVPLCTPFLEALVALLTTVKSEGPKLAKALPQVMGEPDQCLLSPSRLLSEKGNTSRMLEPVLIRLRTHHHQLAINLFAYQLNLNHLVRSEALTPVTLLSSGM
jgi:hypothetical protein